jgi:hypothetical protein
VCKHCRLVLLLWVACCRHCSVQQTSLLTMALFLPGFPIPPLATFFWEVIWGIYANQTIFASTTHNIISSRPAKLFLRIFWSGWAKTPTG